MTQLPIGPPTKPLTPLDDAGLKRIADRLALVIDTTGMDDEMVPAIKNTIETLITQDMPALLSYVIAHKRPDIEAEIPTQIWPLL